MNGEQIEKHSLIREIDFILINIVWLIVAILGTGVIGKVLIMIGLGANFLSEFFPRLLVGFMLLWRFKKRYPDVIIGVGKDRWRLGLILGWPVYISSIINFYETIVDVNWSIAVVPTALEYIGYLIYVIAIGVFEEGLLRGIMLNKMINRWGNTRSGIYKAVMASSIIFGIIHFVNLAGKPWLVVTTCTQVCYAFMIGFFFAAVYVRTRNFWIVVGFHALYDLGGSLDRLFIRQVSEKINPDISIMDGVMTLLPFTIFIVVGLFYMRSDKLEGQDKTLDTTSLKRIGYKNI